jgi:Tfp pilus assembly protein PilF
MGIFDWLTGKNRKAKPQAEPEASPPEIPRKKKKLKANPQEKLGKEPGARPRPKVVTGLEEGSLFVTVGSEDGTLTLMDRDTYDYQYGESKLPDPAQRDLTELLPRVTRVRALSGGMIRGEAVTSAVLLDTSDPEALKAFRRCFSIVEDPQSFGHCACLGGPTLELFAGAEPVATIGLQHGNAIRWSAWKHDAQLWEGERLTTWLVENGAHPSLIDLLYQNPFPFTGGRVDDIGTEPLSQVRQRVFMAQTFLGLNNLPGALAECDALLAEDPTLGDAYEIRAHVRKRTGKIELGLADFSKAIEHQERPANALFGRALLLDHLGRREEAIDDCTRAIELDPDHKNAYNSRGVIRMMLGQLDLALPDFNMANLLDPDWEMPYLNRAQLGLFSSNWESAAVDYTLAIEKMESSAAGSKSPLLALLYWNRARAYGQLGDAAQAAADQREALRRDPTLASQSGQRVFYE